MFAQRAAGGAGRAVERDMGEEDGGEVGDLGGGVGESGFGEFVRGDLAVCKARVGFEALLDSQRALDKLLLLLLRAGEEVNGGPP